MTPQDMIKVCRTNYSTSMRDIIQTECPKIANVEKIESKLKIGFFFDGGPRHDFCLWIYF